MRIEVYEDENSEYRWRFVASNGKCVAQGESHDSRGKAIRAAKGVVKAVCNKVFSTCAPFFTTTERDGVTVITWN